jgi:sphingomyelin phosphodiesterase acid-like 3
MGKIGILLMLAQAWALGKFFVVSDLHYDIGYEPDYNETYYCHSRKYLGQKTTPVPTANLQPLVRPRCDSSLGLIETAFSQMKFVDPSPDFILVTGDTIGHFTSTFYTPDGTYDPLYNMFLLKQSFSDISALIQRTFPDTQAIFAIGNNDVYVDYEMPEKWDKVFYLDFLYGLWDPLGNDIPSAFFVDGYYSTKTKTGYTVLVLNSLLFGVNEKEMGVQSKIQLTWLRSQLVTNKDVIIAMHIPPSLSLYGGGGQAWYDSYSQAFINVVKEYAANIRIILGGHYHSGYFQLVGNTPFVLNPSISPLFGNNPGFRHFDLEKNDYTEYTFNAFNTSAGWQSASFSEIYGYTMNYTRLFGDLQSGAVSLDDYMERITGLWVTENYDYNTMCACVFGNACAKGPAYTKQVTLCEIQYQTLSGFNSCMSAAGF